MTLRRYAPMKQSRGTVIPPAMRLRVLYRDNGCIGAALLPGPCGNPNEIDHVRASHAMGMKSVTCDCNLVTLCGAHHRYKTSRGREVRPVLLDYLAKFEYDEHAPDHLEGDCGHVDPRFDCDTCQRRVPA